mmetsp:Transcript_4082/g.10289  ORF Transcript_4082/g.10289 Transcript_4082/m.10289 type:complete len:533 (+) Transcript_4082:120-1718(+)
MGCVSSRSRDDEAAEDAAVNSVVFRPPLNPPCAVPVGATHSHPAVSPARDFLSPASGGEIKSIRNARRGSSPYCTADEVDATEFPTKRDRRPSPFKVVVGIDSGETVTSPGDDDGAGDKPPTLRGGVPQGAQNRAQGAQGGRPLSAVFQTAWRNAFGDDDARHSSTIDDEEHSAPTSPTPSAPAGAGTGTAGPRGGHAGTTISATDPSEARGATAPADSPYKVAMRPKKAATAAVAAVALRVPGSPENRGRSKSDSDAMTRLSCSPRNPLYRVSQESPRRWSDSSAVGKRTSAEHAEGVRFSAMLAREFRRKLGLPSPTRPVSGGSSSGGRSLVVESGPGPAETMPMLPSEADSGIDAGTDGGTARPAGPHSDAVDGYESEPDYDYAHYVRPQSAHSATESVVVPPGDGDGSGQPVGHGLGRDVTGLPTAGVLAMSLTDDKVATLGRAAIDLLERSWEDEGLQEFIDTTRHTPSLRRKEVQRIATLNKTALDDMVGDWEKQGKLEFAALIGEGTAKVAVPAQGGDTTLNELE